MRCEKKNKTCSFRLTNKSVRIMRQVSKGSPDSEEVLANGIRYSLQSKSWESLQSHIEILEILFSNVENYHLLLYSYVLMVKMYL